MRKITLLFASLFLVMGSAWAQWDGYKLKSVSTTPATTLESGYYVIYNNGRGTFMNSEGALGQGKVTWPTTASAAGIDALNSAEDLTNTGAKNKKAYVFYVDVQEGNKVSLQTGYNDYIPVLTGNDTFNYSAEKGVWNYNFKVDGENSYLFLWSDNNVGLDCNGWEASSHTYSTMAGWNKDTNFSTSGNQSWTLHKATMELANLVKVTYVYKVGDEVYATSTPIEQDANSEAAAPKVDFLTINSYTGTIADEDCEIVVNCSVSLPFEAADKVENITEWYLMKMHSNNPMYIEPVVIETDGKKEHKIEWKDATVTEANKDAHLWAFVGNLKDGFIVVNNNGLAINNSIQMDEVANAEKFKLAATSETSENAKNGFCLKHSNGKYLNAQNPLSTWGSTDAGSTIMLEEYVSVEAINIVTVDWEYEWVELMEMGATVKLAAEFTPANATDKTITWSSDNEELLTVKDGVASVVGYGSGMVNITATAAHGKEATFEIYVYVPQPGVQSVSVYSGNGEMELSEIGAKIQLVAEVMCTPGTPDEDKVLTWSSNVDAVSVDNTGLVTLKEAYDGQIIITATAPNGVSGMTYLIATVAGETAELNEIILNTYFISEDKALKVGETFQLVATFDPAEAAEELVWESSDEDVLKVDENGLVKAVGAGEAEITVTTVSDYGRDWFTKSCTIYVVEGGETGIDAVEADAKTVIYDLTGRRVEKMEKGIYIVNGKKVVIK